MVVLSKPLLPQRTQLLTASYYNSDYKQMFVGCKIKQCKYVRLSYQELMKEGASNCVERHLNLNDCDTSLLWTYSQVGHKCCFHSQRITPRAARTRTYVRVYTALARGDSKLRFTIAAMEQEREGEIERLGKRQVTTPHRTAKRSRLLEAKQRSKTIDIIPYGKV